MMLMPPYTPMSEPLRNLRRRRATMAATTPFDRTRACMEAYGLHIPVLLAPMARACPPAPSVAVGGAGGMGACGPLLMQAAALVAWQQEVSAGPYGPFPLTLWFTAPPPAPDPTAHAP